KQLLRPETIARMEYPQTPLSARNGLRLGYGLANYTEVEGGVVTHGHDGGIDGFISTYRYMPEQNWGYVVLLNSDFSGKALHDLNELAIDFLSKDFLKLQQAAQNISVSELEKFSGFYESRAPRNKLFTFLTELLDNRRVRIQNGRLVIGGMFGQPKTVISVGKNLFRNEKDPEATIAFYPNAAGQMCFTSTGEDGTSYAERINPVWPYLRLSLLLLSGLLLASSLLYAIFWGILWLARKLKEVKHLGVRAVPFFATLSLVISFFCAGKSVDTLGALGFWSVLFFLGTIAFAVLSFIGLYLAVSVPRTEIHPAIRTHSLLVSLACCTLAIFLASWHLLALRLCASCQSLFWKRDKLQQRIDVAVNSGDFTGESDTHCGCRREFPAHDPGLDLRPVFARRPPFVIFPFALGHGIPVALILSAEPLLLPRKPFRIFRNARVRDKSKRRLPSLRPSIHAKSSGNHIRGDSGVKLSAFHFRGNWRGKFQIHVCFVERLVFGKTDVIVDARKVRTATPRRFKAWIQL